MDKHWDVLVCVVNGRVGNVVGPEGMKVLVKDYDVDRPCTKQIMKANTEPDEYGTTSHDTIWDC